MQNIRTKSHIPIDPSQGRVLLGVVDETFSLEYGQVFIQISTDVKNPLSVKQILQQMVLVGKSPCLHPGAKIKRVHKSANLSFAKSIHCKLRVCV